MIYVPPYSQDLCECIGASLDEATRFGHDAVEPEHALLAMLRLAETDPRVDLCGLDVDPAIIRRDLDRLLERGDGTFHETYRPSPPMRRVMDRAWRIAGEMRFGFVCCEHLLLAMIQDRHCLASYCLNRHGIDYRQARLHAYWHIRETFPVRNRFVRAIWGFFLRKTA